jgi:formylglycine-generating enzyme required for sulfatase activity
MSKRLSIVVPVFLVLAYGAWAFPDDAPGDAPAKGKLIKNSVGMTLVRIPAGEFVMGAADREKGMTYNEQPQHRVRITKPFYLGKHEVTQAEWTAIMGRNPSAFMPGGFGEDKVKGLDTRRFPVEMVSWFDAVQYCNSLSERDELPPYYAIENVRREEGSIRSADVSIPNSGGRGYRLPTEAEWEYACRAGTTTPFHFGSVANGSEENIDGAYPPYVTKRKGEPLKRTTTVGTYKANAFGLHDMHGNVREWCHDGWAENAYVGRRGTITSDPVVDTGDERVMRGGSWLFDGDFCRSAARSRVLPRIPSSETGLRVARNP